MTLCGAAGDLRHKNSLAAGREKLLKYLKRTDYSHLHSLQTRRNLGAALGNLSEKQKGIWVVCHLFP